MGRLRQNEKDFTLGYRFFSSFFLLLPYLYRGFEWAAALSVLTIICNAGKEWVNYYSGKIIGHFYSALLSRNESYFRELFWKATLIYIGQTLLLATVSFFSWLLYLSMRKNLVTALHSLYYKKNVYYQLNSIDNDGIDNPDQRITQDAERMCSLLAKNILPYLLISPGVIAWYTWKTWKAAGPIGVGIIYAYFIIGVIMNRILVSPITKWTARVEKSEGDFRYKHVSVRNNAEESAFYDASLFEEYESNKALFTLLRRQLSQTLWKYLAQFFQNFFDYYGGVLSYLIQVIPIFILNSYKNMNHDDLAGLISNNAFFFITLISSCTRLTDLALSLGEMAGYTQRIAEIVRYARAAEDMSSNAIFQDPSNSDDNLIIIKNLSYSLPTDYSYGLVSGLDLTLPKNKTLLITGGSGVGKSSLLRVLKNLWHGQSGIIIRNTRPKDMMYLPQRPYFPVGQLSLRQQIVFPQVITPKNNALIDNGQILKILHSLSLNNLIGVCGGLNENVDFEWQDTLSPGEQQRLSIGRVLYHKPSVVVLDEATSSLSIETESLIYNLLKEYQISYISTGHRKSLDLLHDWELRLDQKNWKLIKVAERLTQDDHI